MHDFQVPLLCVQNKQHSNLCYSSRPITQRKTRCGTTSYSYGDQEQDLSGKKNHVVIHQAHNKEQNSGGTII